MLRGLAGLYLDWGRPHDAEGYVKAVIEIVRDATSQFELADYYVTTARYDEAIATLTTLAADKKLYARAQTRIALVEYARGRKNEAHRRVDEAIEAEPRNAEALTTKARLLLTENRPQEALLRLQTAMEVNSRLPETLLALGRTHLALTNVEEARRYLNDAIKVDPTLLGALLELSDLHLRRREIETAVQLAEQALNAHRDSVPARLALIRALSVRLDDAPRAEREIKRLLATHPNSAAIHHAAGEFLLKRNNNVAARQAFDRALQLAPQATAALTALVALDIADKKMEQGRARVDGLLARNPHDAGALVLAAKVYGLTGEDSKVEELLKRALEADASNPEAYAPLSS